MSRARETISVDQRGRSYLGKLGFEPGETLVADPIEGDEHAWVIRPGRIVTELEVKLLSNPENAASLQRAAAEALAGEEGQDLI